MKALQTDVRLRNGTADGKPVIVRVKKSTASTDSRVKAKMEAMIRLLWDQPRNRRLVHEIADGTRSLLDVYAAHEAGTIADLAPAFEDREVQPMLDAWLSIVQASESHRHRMRQSLSQLMKEQRATVRLSDLGRLLVAYQARCLKENTPRSFNYARAALFAFFHNNGIGKRHPTYLDVLDVSRLKERKQGVTGLTMAEARAVCDRLRALEMHPRGAKEPDYHRGEHAARIFWAMCCTGMGAAEYWGEWTVLSDRVRIVGRKRPGRSWGGAGRDVPLLTVLPRPEMTADYFGHLLARVDASPYQARKSYAQWLEDAEIPRAYRRMYLGHGAKDVTDLYERREVSAFLKEHTARLLTLLGEPTGPALVKEG